MAALAESMRDILLKPGHDPLEQMLARLLAGHRGDVEMSVAFTGLTVAASTNATQAATFAPPLDQTTVEFIPVAIVIGDQAQIDSLDRVSIDYQDVIINQILTFFSSRASQGSGISAQQWTWPSPLAEQALATFDTMLMYTELPLFRRVNGEAWRRLLFNFSTTATVGTRSFNCRVLYRRRPSTRI